MLKWENVNPFDFSLAYNCWVCLNVFFMVMFGASKGAMHISPLIEILLNNDHSSICANMPSVENPYFAWSCIGFTWRSMGVTMFDFFEMPWRVVNKRRLSTDWISWYCWITFCALFRCKWPIKCHGFLIPVAWFFSPCCTLFSPNASVGKCDEISVTSLGVAYFVAKTISTDEGMLAFSWWMLSIIKLLDMRPMMRI